MKEGLKYAMKNGNNAGRKRMLQKMKSEIILGIAYVALGDSTM